MRKRYEVCINFFLRLWKLFCSWILFNKPLKTMSNFFIPALCLNIDVHVIFVGLYKDYYIQNNYFIRDLDLWDWSTQYLCCQLVTNRFLFFRTIQWHIYSKKSCFCANRCTSCFTSSSLTPWNSSKLSIKPFKYFENLCFTHVYLEWSFPFQF